jgi:YggT family protein
MNVAEVVYTFINWLGFILTGAIIIRVLFSWFAMGNAGGPVVRLLDDITEPVLSPLRRVIPTIGMIDISPLIAILLIQGITALVLGQIHY